LEIKEECTKCGIAVCVKCYAKYEDTRFALFLAENNKTRHLRTLKSYSENPNNSEFEPFKVKWSLTQRLWAAQAKAKRASKRAAIALKEARYELFTESGTFRSVREHFRTFLLTFKA